MQAETRAAGLLDVGARASENRAMMGCLAQRTPRVGPVLAAVIVCVTTACFARPAEASPLMAVVEAERAGRCAALGDESLRGTGTERALALARHARCAIDEGAFDLGVAQFRAFERAPAGVDDTALPWLAELRARVLLLDGRPAEAALAFEALNVQASAHRTSSGVRARWLYYEALAREASDDPAADVLYAQLLVEHPGSTYASRAQLRPGRAEHDRATRLHMASRALDARHYAAAETLLTLAACGSADGCAPFEAVGSGDPVRYEAAYQLGYLLYRFRREFVERSLPWFETIMAAGGPRLADARYGYAAAVTRIGRFDESRRAWTVFLRAHADDSRADEAQFHRAWLFLEEDRFADARREFAAYLRDGRRVSDARWWLGWAAAEAGDCDAAIATWDALRTDQSAYWTAVCRARSGDSAAARAAWQELAADDPWSYYGLLATQRLGQSPPTAASPVAFGAPDHIAVRAAALGLAAESDLLAAADDARFADDPGWNVAVHAGSSSWGRWRSEWSADADAAPSTRDQSRRWWLAHPRFYEPVVTSEAQRAGLDPALIWAIMQKESSYNPRAISRSDAMGLMQVIPQTAEAIARRLGERYADGMLFEPYHAIRYGAWYLGALREHFGDQPVLAIAAYNAGPIVVEAWVDRNADRPLDVFVEEIPFDQARDYVRRVLSIQAHYRVAAGDAAAFEGPSFGGLLPAQIRGGYGDVVDF